MQNVQNCIPSITLPFLMRKGENKNEEEDYQCLE